MNILTINVYEWHAKMHVVIIVSGRLFNVTVSLVSGWSYLVQVWDTAPCDLTCLSRSGNE